MANLNSPCPSSSSCSSPSFEKPVSLSSVATSSTAGAPDDAFEEHCSICLEAFSNQNPATVTSCRHEYHLQCILEWAQRSRECPICWQLFILKDPVSQELLTAMEFETKSSLRNMSPLPPSYDSGHYDREVPAYTGDSDFEYCIMQHLAAAAAVRRTRFHRRERQRASGFEPFDSSGDVLFNSPANMSWDKTLPRDSQNVCHVSQQPDDSPTSGGVSANSGPPSPIIQSASPRLSPAVDGDEPTEQRAFILTPEQDGPQRPKTHETTSFCGSIISKWSTASARYKESLSRSTRGLKEKLNAGNISVKKLSKGVQCEMTAGIAGVTRMIERLEIASKSSWTPIPVSSNGGVASNFLSKGKDVQGNRCYT